MKAILLARVSSQEQEQGHSIPAQVHRLREYAQRRGLEVVETHSITESSTKDSRKKFEAMLEMIRSSRETIALVADTIDRVQRSFRESIVLLELLKDGKIEIHFLRESLVLQKDSNSSELIRWDMGVVFARAYVLQLSDNVKRDNEQKIRSGEWTGKAPLGYLNVKVENDRPWIVLDPERAPHVRRIFELYARGDVSMETLAERMEADGLRTLQGERVAPSVIEWILKNPFYHGTMRWKGTLHPHRYEPLVEEELWQRAEAVREGWHKKPFQYAAKPFVFRGLIRCGHCGSTLSPQRKREIHVYYSCGKKGCAGKSVYAREEDLLQEVTGVLKRLVLPDAVIGELTTALKQHGRAQQEFHLAAIHALQAEQERIQRRIGRMYDDKLDGAIPAELYERKQQEFQRRLSEIHRALRTHTEADHRYHVTASLVLDLAKRALDLFGRSETHERRLLLDFVFQNLRLEGGKLHYELKEPFDLLVQYADHPGWWPLLDAFGTFDWGKWQQFAEDVRAFLESLRVVAPTALTSGT